LQAALEREKLVSTNMDGCLAFPHARLPGLNEVSFALGKSAAPLAWGRTAVPTVRLVFLLAVPANDSAQYLPLISGVVRLSKDKSLLAKLLAAGDAQEMFEILRQVEVRIKSTATPLVTTFAFLFFHLDPSAFLCHSGP